MTIFTLKTVKPFNEQLVKAKGINDSFTIGVNQYTITEQQEKYREFISLGHSVQLLRLFEELQELLQDRAKSVDETLKQKEILEKQIASLSELAKAESDGFLLNEVCYLKNVNCFDPSSIKDSREFKFEGSPYADEKELVSALLTILLNQDAYREPLLSAMQKGIFGSNYREEEVKNSKG